MAEDQLSLYNDALQAITSLNVVQRLGQTILSPEIQEKYFLLLDDLKNKITSSLINNSREGFTTNALSDLKRFSKWDSKSLSQSNLEAITLELNRVSDKLEVEAAQYRLRVSEGYTSELDMINKRIADINEDIGALDDFQFKAVGLIEEFEQRAATINRTAAEVRDQAYRIFEYDKRYIELRAKLESYVQDIALQNERQVKLIDDLTEASSKYADYERTYEEAIVTIETTRDKSNHIEDLLLKARTKVGLDATDGISAAFIKVRDESKNGLGYWILGTLVFVVLSLAATAWILLGWNISHPNEWSSIIGRVVAVSILIGGATFCSRQYIRQKSIADDYTYKAVLSQSILAFTDEIKDRSDVQVVEYLSKVLGEIHKDPQRSRKSELDSTIKVEILDTLTKLATKITPAK